MDLGERGRTRGGNGVGLGREWGQTWKGNEVRLGEEHDQTKGVRLGGRTGGVGLEGSDRVRLGPSMFKRK